MYLIIFIADSITSWLMFGINSDVMNLRLFDIVITNETLSTNIMYSEILMFTYIYFISGGIKIHVAINSGDNIPVVFHFRYPKFVPVLGHWGFL